MIFGCLFTLFTGNSVFATTKSEINSSFQKLKTILDQMNDALYPGGYCNNKDFYECRDSFLEKEEELKIALNEFELRINNGVDEVFNMFQSDVGAVLGNELYFNRYLKEAYNTPWFRTHVNHISVGQLWPHDFCSDEPMPIDNISSRNFHKFFINQAVSFINTAREDVVLGVLERIYNIYKGVEGKDEGIDLDFNVFKTEEDIRGFMRFRYERNDLYPFVHSQSEQKYISIFENLKNVVINSMNAFSANTAKMNLMSFKEFFDSGDFCGPVEQKAFGNERNNHSVTLKRSHFTWLKTSSKIKIEEAQDQMNRIGLGSLPGAPVVSTGARKVGNLSTVTFFYLDNIEPIDFNNLDENQVDFKKFHPGEILRDIFTGQKVLTSENQRVHN